MSSSYSNTVSFGDREVGAGCPVFVTFEAGPTHDGLESACRLAGHAADAGGNAVKFQIFDPDRLVADRSMPFSYEVLVDRDTGRTETVEEPLYDILCRRCLTREEWIQLKRHCDGLGLAFFATVGFSEDIHLLEELGCDSIKIASADVNHAPLIRQAAATGMCLQLDTGSASLGEIESAVDLIRSCGNERIIIHQCPSGYPARLPSINLRVIQTLRQMFPYPVAYSDHTPGWEMDVAAVALGANLVEKTITEDRLTRSVEHVMSIEPSEMTQFVRILHDIETALGSPRRVLAAEELARRKNVRRSAFLSSDAAAGDLLRDVAVDFRRPGDGIDPVLFESILDSRLKHSLPSGHKLEFGDLSG